MTVRDTGDETEYVCACGGIPLVVDPIDLEGLTKAGYRFKFLHGDAERPHSIALAGRTSLRLPGVEPVPWPE